MNENILLAMGLFLFTGVETSVDAGTAIDVISKFGVIAVLWYWLQTLKKQLSTQIKEFRAETAEIRNHYGKILDDKRDECKEYMDRIESLIKQKED